MVLGNYPEGYGNYPPEIVHHTDYYINKKEVGVGFKYPWGNNFFKGQAPPEYKLCNWRLRYYAYRYPDTNGRVAKTGYPLKSWQTDGYRESAASVGSFSPQGDSPYGVCDIAGNVWEWTNTPYAKFENKLFVIKAGAGTKVHLRFTQPGQARTE